jgi:hypothetical protein
MPGAGCLGAITLQKPTLRSIFHNMNRPLRSRMSSRAIAAHRYSSFELPYRRTATLRGAGRPPGGLNFLLAAWPGRSCAPGSMPSSYVAETARPYVCGGSAACFASFCIHPIDVTKVCTWASTPRRILATTTVPQPCSPPATPRARTDTPRNHTGYLRPLCRCGCRWYLLRRPLCLWRRAL